MGSVNIEKNIKIKYVTPERMNLVNKENLKLYDRYLKSSILKNSEVKETTYVVYKSYFNQFLVYLLEEWDNISLYDEDFFENAVDIMEGFMSICVETLKNNKKIINTKISAVSSFYIWAKKRKEIKYHPFNDSLDRIKGSKDEHLTNDYFLTEEQIKIIDEELKINPKYDLQDRIIFNLGIDSANRVKALSLTTLSSLNLKTGSFENIREKRGKRVEIIFEDYTESLIIEWLEKRKYLDNLDVDALFITKQNGQYKYMTKATIYNRVKKIGRIIGLEDFHPHCLRKSSLNNTFELTGDIEVARDMANHGSTETTMTYIRPKTKTEQRDKIKKARQQREIERNKIVDNEVN